MFVPVLFVPVIYFVVPYSCFDIITIYILVNYKVFRKMFCPQESNWNRNNWNIAVK